MARANPGSQVVINTDFDGIASDYPDAKHTLGRGKAQDPKQSLEKLLGTTLKFTPATSVNLDTKEGYAHSTTGIPYAISGTATVVSQKVGAWLAGFQDPIKAILGVGVHTNNKIIIKRKYVVGGSATITPERAPARTVAIKEDVREVSLTRYGGDIEMNLNLFLRPEDAEEELTMKLDAQKRELERKLVDLGYMTLMQEGTPIIDAIIRSNPTMGAPTNALEAERYYRTAKRIYCNNIFGALNKHRFPVANLLSAARYASAYSTGTQKGSVMILPHGIPDLLRYSRKENMSYSVSGLKAGHGGKIDMKLEGSFEDPNSGVAILIHHPTPTYEHGVAKPNISIESGGLTDETIVVSKHDIKNAPKGDTSRALWECEMYWGTAIAPVNHATPGDADAEIRQITYAIGPNTTRPTGNNFDPLRSPTGNWPVVTVDGYSEVDQFKDGDAPEKDQEFILNAGKAAYKAGMQFVSRGMQSEGTIADVVNGGLLKTGCFNTIAHSQGSFKIKHVTTNDFRASIVGGEAVESGTEREADGPPRERQGGPEQAGTTQSDEEGRRLAAALKAVEDESTAGGGGGSGSRPAVPYVAPAARKVDSEVYSLTTEPVNFSVTSAATSTDVKVYRIARVVASSAILAAPGSQTGELLIGYPFTGVSTSHAEERMRIQLRCYLGAALYQPDNVLIMPNVFVEGITECVYYVERDTHKDMVYKSAAAEVLDGISPEDKAGMYANRNQSVFDSVGVYTHRGNTGQPVNWIDYGCKNAHPLMDIFGLDEYRFATQGEKSLAPPGWLAGAFKRDPKDVHVDATRMQSNAGAYVGMRYQDMEHNVSAWCGSAARGNMMMWRELHCMLAVIMNKENVEETGFDKTHAHCNLGYEGSEGAARKRDALVREMTGFHYIYACSRQTDGIAANVPNPKTDLAKRGCWEAEQQFGTDPVAANNKNSIRNPMMNLARCATILDWTSLQFDRLSEGAQQQLIDGNCGKDTWATSSPASLSLSELLNWTALNAVADVIDAETKEFKSAPSLAGVFRDEGVTGKGNFFNTAGDPVSLNDVNDAMGDWPTITALGKASQGATYNSATGEQLMPNTGEFGDLDHPSKYAILHGAPQSFEGGQHGVGTGAL
jgi:hypothetical protein